MVQQPQGRSPEAAVLRECLEGLRPVVDALLGAFEGLGEAQRWDALAAVGELAKCADGAVVRMAGLVEQAPPAWDARSRAFGYRDAADALRHELGVTAGRAKAIVRVAVAATPRPAGGAPSGPRFPHVADALADGSIGIDQARVVVERLDEGRWRVDDDDRQVAEAALVGDATGQDPAGEAPAGEAPAGEARRLRGYGDTAPTPPEELAATARQWLLALDPDGAEPREEQQIAQRSVTLSRCTDGMFRGRMLLPPDQGAAVLAVLDAYNAPRTSKDPTAPVEDDGRSPQQRSADVLAGLFTAHARSGDAPRPGGRPPTLLVAVTQADLDAHAEGRPGFCELVETGEIVPVQLAARMTCDAFVQAALVDGDGHVLKMGRRKRLFTAIQRLAIILRDRCCQGEGCGAPASWNDVHHVRRWADGGKTDTDNGILLCIRCHGDVHAGRQHIERAGTRWKVRRTLLPPTRRPIGPKRRAAWGAIERLLSTTG